MDAQTTDYAAARKFMTEGQIKPNDITDQKLLRAFLNTPREAYFDKSWQNVAYAERAIPLENNRQSLSPLSVAKMLQALDLKSTDRVLDIGGAPGYTAALLSSQVAHITLLEEDGVLAEQAQANITQQNIGSVQVVSGTLADGYAAAAPYNVIILEGAVAAAPEHLVAQLASDGRLVSILVTPKGAKITLFKRIGDQLSSQAIFDASAPYLPGYAPQEQFVF